MVNFSEISSYGYLFPQSSTYESEPGVNQVVFAPY